MSLFCNYDATAEKNFRKTVLADFAAIINNQKIIINTLNQQGTKIMATLAEIQASVAALTQDVTDENTVIESAITLLNGLTAQIAALVAQVAQDPAVLQSTKDAADALLATVTAEKDKLAAAVAANTPGSAVIESLADLAKNIAAIVPWLLVVIWEAWNPLNAKERASLKRINESYAHYRLGKQ